MRNSSLRFVVLLLVGAAILITTNRLFLHGAVAGEVVSVMAQPQVFLLEKSASLRASFREAFRWKKLSQENSALQSENVRLKSQLAELEDMQSENEFLRRAANIPQRGGATPVHAQISTMSAVPAGYSFIINQGSKAGVAVGNVVITDEQALVGRVVEVFDRAARVQPVFDPAFSVTAKVLSGTTSGIVKGSAGRTLQFDLIVQGDDIHEGDTIISSGNDAIPGALVIGTVEHIKVDEAKLFKEVRIRPAISDVLMGRVLILSQ